MNHFESKDYPIFQMFHDQWALAAAGTPERHNACTISWGSMGTLWTRPDSNGAAITIYIHPARHTCQFLRESETFTVSFFPPEQRRALQIMGSRSGRNEDKTALAGLTPIALGSSVGFREAETTFLCRKLYQHQFAREDIHPDVQAYYAARPGAYPPGADGVWQPHWMFVGQVLDVVSASRLGDAP